MSCATELNGLPGSQDAWNQHTPCSLTTDHNWDIHNVSSRGFVTYRGLGGSAAGRRPPPANTAVEPPSCSSTGASLDQDQIWAQEEDSTTEVLGQEVGRVRGERWTPVVGSEGGRGNNHSSNCSSSLLSFSPDLRLQNPAETPEDQLGSLHPLHLTGPAHSITGRATPLHSQNISP